MSPDAAFVLLVMTLATFVVILTAETPGRS